MTQARATWIVVLSIALVGAAWTYRVVRLGEAYPPSCGSLANGKFEPAGPAEGIVKSWREALSDCR